MRTKIWMRIAVAVVALVSLGVGTSSRVFAASHGGLKVSTLSYHDDWRKLWEDHITWTRMVVIGVLDDVPGTPAYVSRLLQNPGDMAAALESYYGAAANELGALITQHLELAAEILQDAKTGQTNAMNDAIARWYANGHDIAVKMAAMNPRSWPLSMGEPMWKQHLDLTLTEAVDHLKGDYTGDVAAYEQIHVLALEMADFFSDGVVRQFPGAFSGPKNKVME